MRADDLDLLKAGLDLLGRMRAVNTTIGWSDDHEPGVWWAVADFPGGISEAAGGMNATTAVVRLIEVLADGGGTCTHCGRPTGVAVELGSMPLADAICWYQYDPELKTFRRGCEGDSP